LRNRVLKFKKKKKKKKKKKEEEEEEEKHKLLSKYVLAIFRCFRPLKALSIFFLYQTGTFLSNGLFKY
jgi:hypothetical protein